MKSPSLQLKIKPRERTSVKYSKSVPVGSPVGQNEPPVPNGSHTQPSEPIGDKNRVCSLCASLGKDSGEVVRLWWAENRGMWVRSSVNCLYEGTNSALSGLTSVLSRDPVAPASLRYLCSAKLHRMFRSHAHDFSSHIFPWFLCIPKQMLRCFSSPKFLLIASNATQYN
jgi:hypothetical protein